MPKYKQLLFAIGFILPINCYALTFVDDTLFTIPLVAVDTTCPHPIGYLPPSGFCPATYVINKAPQTSCSPQGTRVGTCSAGQNCLCFGAGPGLVINAPGDINTTCSQLANYNGTVTVQSFCDGQLQTSGTCTGTITIQCTVNNP